jgi:hypothetical protein
MSDAVAWVAVGISVASASFAALAPWTNREKLRLDLSDRYRIHEGRSVRAAGGGDRVKVALCACFPPKVHSVPEPVAPGLLCDVSKQHVAEGHSNATILLSDDASPLSGSLN